MALCSANPRLLWIAGHDECSPSPSSSDDEKVVLPPDSGISSGQSSPQHAAPERARLERSKTLPSALVSTPKAEHNHKCVRFADAVGFDLEQCAFFRQDDDCTRRQHSRSYPSFPLDNAVCSLRLTPSNWRPPSPDQHSHLVRTRRVALRSISLAHMQVTGIVDVLNVHFVKQVCVRYSKDAWTSAVEQLAVYLSCDSPQGDVDSFSFTMRLADMKCGDECVFCIRYTVDGSSFWDNNHGLDYVLRCSQCIDTQHHAIKPLWPDHCPDANFPTFKARGWRQQRKPLCFY